MTILNDIKVFETAIQKRKQIHMLYDSLSSGERYRRVEPWYIFKRHAYYYLVGFCRDRYAIRIFHTKRIRTYTITDTECKEKPIPFSSIRKKKLRQLGKSEKDSMFFDTSKIIMHAYIQKMESDLRSLDIKLKKELDRLSPPKRGKTEDGYPFTIHLNKMDKASKCRSPLEHKIFLDLESNKLIIKIEVEPFRIRYFYRKVSHLYTPDILVTYRDGTKDLIEVKVSGDIGQPKNQAKFEAAADYAKALGYRFYIMGISGSSGQPGARNEGWNDLNQIQTRNFHHKYIENYDSCDNEYKRLKPTFRKIRKRQSIRKVRPRLNRRLKIHR
ncbi:WYL domain-containing protein [Paenibacillus sp. CF384]|uniref:TnsA endonuclease N-terminal domain-containing protein n=1 Tax=Paenibacillus sp. CF384 TaxID=1884382 RepID=UPI00089449E2|nr:WYL domain-containing protein [Paenibacillus sp. CF384]SDW77194.1 TnsA endonuclease N terminal [Paenibacillus sp. CF384]